MNPMPRIHPCSRNSNNRTSIKAVNAKLLAVVAAVALAASSAQAANLLVTAKRMYARLLRLAVGEYESDPDAIDHEIADLRRLLAAHPAAPAPGDDY